MSHSFDDVYPGLLGGFSEFGDGSKRSKAYEPDDMESFFTSKEIAKDKKLQAVMSKGGKPLKGAPAQIEEDFHFTRYSKRREHKYTETEMKQIRESCESTIVHDYSKDDIYHLSDEERRRRDVLADLRLKLGTLHRTYNRIDEYIYAMRVVLQAWEILAKQNFLHTEEEFYQMIQEGKIVSNSIIMPKMRRIDQYNMDLVIKYISTPDADPKDLLTMEQQASDPYYDREPTDFYSDPKFMEYVEEILERYVQEDKDKPEDERRDIEDGDVIEAAEQEALDRMEIELMQRYLTPEEVERIRLYKEHPPQIQVKDLNPKWIRGYDDKRFGKKRKQKLSKSEKYHMESVHDLLNRIQEVTMKSDGFYASTWLANSLFDEEEKEQNPYEKIRFTGSWADKEAVWLYNLIQEEVALDQKVPGNIYQTYRDQKISEFFKTLESAGVNVIELRRRMECTDEDVAQQRKKAISKENKRIEAAMIQRITKLNHDKKFRKTAQKAEEKLKTYEE